MQIELFGYKILDRIERFLSFTKYFAKIMEKRFDSDLRYKVDFENNLAPKKLPEIMKRNI